MKLHKVLPRTLLQDGPQAHELADAQAPRTPNWDLVPETAHTWVAQSGGATILRALVERLEVLIFSGDVDACVPYTGTQQWTREVAETNGWTSSHYEWSPWLVDGQVAGYFETFATGNPAQLCADCSRSGASQDCAVCGKAQSGLMPITAAI